MKIILLSFFRQKTNKGQCMAWHNGKFWPLYVPEWYHPKVSQYFFDPYSFCHILHWFIFYGLWGWWVPSTFGWGETQTWWWTWVCGAFLGLFMEFCHEMIENSEIGISRFRNTSGTSEFYKGDSLQNIIGDIISAMFGWFLTAVLHQAGYPWLVLLWTVISELASVLYMRDCGVLIIIQLLFNSESIKAWQTEKIVEVNKNQGELRKLKQNYKN